MSKEKCIVTMYKLLDELTNKEKRFNLLKSRGVCGQDQYAGMSLFVIAFDKIIEEFEQELRDSFRALEADKQCKK